jgi:aminoglycoside phosphotransferase (APT) family kinase protein
LRAKPEFLHDPLREIEVYESILARNSFGTPICYVAVARPDDDHTWIVLERVQGVELYQVGDLETWRSVARWLASFHAQFQARLPTSTHLLRHDRAFYLRWLQRAQKFTDGRLDHVAPRYDRVIDCLVGLPPTFIHGEFYSSNVLVEGRRIAPIDWEVAGIGPGLIDLAALTTGWGEKERRTIENAYGDVPQGALDACRLQIAVQWLGWSSDWTPPPEHARNWLADALAAAERLGL